VGIPGIVWMKVQFSTDAGGWVIAGQSEIGENGNFFAAPNPRTGECRLSFFGGPPFPYAGFWASVTCAVEPPPTGACCIETECSETAEAECSGRWRGPDTSCALNPCATHYLAFQNDFLTGIFFPLPLQTRAADDLRLAEGAAPCELAQYQLDMSGTLGSPSFRAALELWTNNVGQDGVVSEDDIPGAPIPFTSTIFAGIADQSPQRFITPFFPRGFMLPEKVWLVFSTTSDQSGPITAGMASVGYSADTFAVETNGGWELRSFGGFNPDGCPGGAGCTPAGSFRARLRCYGESARGACCDPADESCTDDVAIHDCPGPWRFDVPCKEAQFEGPCGAPHCPSDGPVVFVDPPNGVVDARQPYRIDDASALLGIQSLILTAPPGAEAGCFQLCETPIGDPRNAILDVAEDPPGTYALTLARPLATGRMTTVTYTGTGTSGRFHAHPANINGDGIAGTFDILAIIDCLNRVNPEIACPWGFPYSRDIDHSGAFGTTDLLRTIDLLNGAGAFDPWNGTLLPSGVCP
jgi:hypothetical protein